jgi:hypothetical protein
MLNLFFNFFESLANSLKNYFYKKIKVIFKTKLGTRFDIGTIPYILRTTQPHSKVYYREEGGGLDVFVMALKKLNTFSYVNVKNFHI